jgi:hypothetical protein
LKNKKLMKKSNCLVIFLLLLSYSAFSQEKKWAFGARLGEPGGINIRRYFDERAFEVNVGTYGGIWGKYRGYRKGHYESVGLAVNGHYLWHGNLFKKETAKYYYGFGAQFNNRKYKPDDQNKSQGVASLSIGGSGVAGLEFFLPDSPLSIFLEAGTYAELLPSPFFMHIQSGAGVRFNF